MKSDTPYLSHVADSIAAIESYVAGGREMFFSQRIVQDAVIRNFEIIGEAANKLSPAVRGNSEIPWHRGAELYDFDDIFSLVLLAPHGLVSERLAINTGE